jgi:glycosyltransferase involved in cell wall biosynthesis
MVYEIHSLLGDEVARDRLGRGLVFRMYQELETRVFRHAAAVIALGEPVRQVVIAEKGVPADRVHLIYPGIDLGEYDAPAAPASIPGVRPDHRVVMYVGSIVHPNQGVPILIEALPTVFGAVPEARCVLVGGPAAAGATYQAQLGEYRDRLIVLAGQTPEQVVALTRRADVLVHPRLACRENYSVQSKIAVYLAAGRPIVATGFGDYEQLLGTTGAGLLTAVASAPLADAIVKVLTEPALATRLAAATRSVAEKFFGMDGNVERYLGVYDRAIASSPR